MEPQLEGWGPRISAMGINRMGLGLVALGPGAGAGTGPKFPLSLLPQKALC